jgi:hypothetical protein
VIVELAKCFQVRLHSSTHRRRLPQVSLSQRCVNSLSISLTICILEVQCHYELNTSLPPRRPTRRNGTQTRFHCQQSTLVSPAKAPFKRRGPPTTPDIGISNKAMAILNSFVNDIFELATRHAPGKSKYQSLYLPHLLTKTSSIPQGTSHASTPNSPNGGTEQPRQRPRQTATSAPRRQRQPSGRQRWLPGRQQGPPGWLRLD